MIKFIKIIIFFTITGIALMTIAFSGAYLYLSPGLPDAKSLTDVKLQVPLRIYSSDGKLIGEFGEKKRTPVKIQNVPSLLIKAFLAAEDDRFYQHGGFSIRGLSRAIWQAISGSDAQTGGSTITMQVAKNYFLTPERKISRKLKELFLSIQIEHLLSKNQILELYLNYIFLGHQAYGVAAAAHVYYGKTLDELSLAEMATIAGLPKAPSAYNPIINPSRAKIRRDWILKRMLTLHFITQEDYKTAINTPIKTHKHNADIEVDAAYVAEMVRQEMLKMYGEDAYIDGYRVITTINSQLQDVAQQAVRDGLHEYDWRHGYRKPEAQLDDLSEKAKKAAFNKYPSIADLKTAVVLDNKGKLVKAELADGSIIDIGWDNNLSTIKKYITENRRSQEPKSAKDIVNIGDVIRVQHIGEQWLLSQKPHIEGTLISMNPNNGALLALVGGYDFHSNKFNHATQAKRLVGSNIKPFIYSLALQHGYTAATIINDSPIVYENPYNGEVWEPSNDDGEFHGPTRLRQALYQSRNIVSIKILQFLGVKDTIDYLTKFGFERSSLPKEMSLALGTASFRPIQVVTAYSTFANQGFKIAPYLIDTVYNRDNNIVFKAAPAVVCQTCDPESGKPDTGETQDKGTEAESMEDLLAEPADTDNENAAFSISEINSINSATGHQTPHYAKRIIDRKTVFIIDSILIDTIQKGTGRRALSLKRYDIAGKTATTNGPTDAWFSGYHPNIITTVWTGFDNNTPLGRREYGSTVALPIWIKFMKVALKDQPEMPREPPPGIVSVLINKSTGKRTNPGDPDSMFEYIQEDLLSTLGTEETETKKTTEQIQNLF